MYIFYIFILHIYIFLFYFLHFIFAWRYFYLKREHVYKIDQISSKLNLANIIEDERPGKYATVKRAVNRNTTDLLRGIWHQTQTSISIVWTCGFLTARHATDSPRRADAELFWRPRIECLRCNREGRTSEGRSNGRLRGRQVKTVTDLRRVALVNLM